MITYNQDKYIAQAIDSILMQKTNFEYEIVIGEDCSTDKTREIVLDYKVKYPDKIKLLLQEKNVGMIQNFIDTLKACTGTYIALLEGDDYWTDPYKLQKQFDLMESHPDYSLCYHKVKWVHTSKAEYNPDFVSNNDDKASSDIYDVLNRGWFMSTCSLFFRNIKLPPGFENLYIGDYPLHIFLADKGKLGFINETIAVYRINHKGYTSNVLKVKDFEKRKKNFVDELFLYNYLNQISGNKYQAIFQEKIYHAVHNYLRSISINEKARFFYEFYEILNKRGIVFISKVLSFSFVRLLKRIVNLKKTKN